MLNMEVLTTMCMKLQVIRIFARTLDLLLLSCMSTLIRNSDAYLGELLLCVLEGICMARSNQLGRTEDNE